MNMVRLSESIRNEMLRNVQLESWLEGQISTATAKNEKELSQMMQKGATDFMLSTLIYEFTNARRVAYVDSLQEVQGSDYSYLVQCSKITEAVLTINSIMAKHQEEDLMIYFRVRCTEIPAEETGYEEALRLRREVMSYLERGDKIPVGLSYV